MDCNLEVMGEFRIYGGVSNQEKNQNIVFKQGDLMWDGYLSSQSNMGFLFLRNDSETDFSDILNENGENGESDIIAHALAYIYDEGMFVGGHLHVNIDFPRYVLDVDGDVGFTGSVFIGGDKPLSASSYGEESDEKQMYSWHKHKNTGMYAPDGEIAFQIKGEERFRIGEQGLFTNYGLTSSDEFYTVSDQRLKTDIEPLTGASDILESINGYRFKMKNDPTKKTHTGLIAQELKDVLPEAVHVDTEGMMSVSYNSLISVLVESMRDMRRDIKTMQTEIDALKVFNEKNTHIN